MAENEFILRVIRKQGSAAAVTCGSAIYLGQRYALTCWHVIVGKDEEWGADDAACKCRRDEFSVSSPKSVATARVVSVPCESPRSQLDLALLELDRELPGPALPLLRDVNETFIRNLDECDDVRAWGFACRTDGDAPSSDRIMGHEVERDRYDSTTGRLLDLQLISGSLPHGYSGGAVICRVDGKAACLGVPYLGGEGAATSRFRSSDVVIDQFLAPKLGDDWKQFVLPAESLVPSDQQVAADLLAGYRQAVQKSWGEDFYEKPPEQECQ